ncbi:hypothetical protein ACI799_02755 [Blastococcus sp. SYSU DS0753]
MANGTGILSAGTVSAATPEVARRTWPRWLALGLAMIAVAVVAVVWEAAGARLLLGAVGLFLAVRGAVLLRGARSGAVAGEVAGRARSLGTAAVVAGAAGLVVAVASASLSAVVLLVGVPLLLLVTSLGLLGRGGAARRGGQALLVWSLLVTGLLVVTGLARSWDRAADVATVVAALAVAVLGVPLLVGAANLRTVAATPAPAPVRAGCGGCACGAGGCGS